MLDCWPPPVERISASAIAGASCAPAAHPVQSPLQIRGAALEAHEIAEQIHETAGPPERHAAAESHDWFRRLTAIYVGVAAMLLAIASLGGAGATKEMLNANIHASDTYAFYQAKYLRQTDYQTAADQIEFLAAASPGLSPEAREKAAQLVKRYRAEAAHDESDPKKANGKKELLAKAKEWEAVRDHAAAQTPNFEYAEALFQIAIVLGSVAIVAASPWLLGVSGVLAAGGTLFMLNGYLLLVPLGLG
jgi:Domain of unknown function (DUF4337)